MERDIHACIMIDDLDLRVRMAAFQFKELLGGGSAPFVYCGDVDFTAGHVAESATVAPVPQTMGR